MFVRNATWQRIRGEFSEDEKAELIEALAAETICPPGMHLLATALPRPLIEKLRGAMARVDPGA